MRRSKSPLANFNPVAGGSTNPNNPFTFGVSNPGIIANVTDTDTSGYGGTTENIGSGSCAYDPISNTGIVLSRRLTLSPALQCAQNQANPFAGYAANCPYNVYALVDSGVLP